MKASMSILRIILLCIIFLHLNAIAQAQKGQIGISGNIQNNQSDFLVPIWVANDVVLAPALGFVHISEKASDFSFGVISRVYTSKEKLSPYFGGRFGAIIYSPKSGESVSDFLAGICWGGEYFLDSQFSIGGELQLNVSISDEKSGRFSNAGGYNINTGMALFVSFYFK
jgi:hypothetical protein